MEQEPEQPTEHEQHLHAQEASVGFRLETNEHGDEGANGACHAPRTES